MDDLKYGLYEQFIDILRGMGMSADMGMVVGSLTYSETEAMAYQLTLQLRVLERAGYTLLFWRKSDIMMDNRRHFFLLANLEHLVPIERSQLRLIYPVQLLPEEVAPELLTITALPFSTHLSASYYSLALLCQQSCLAEIAQTKLFYFLERCLKLDPNERSCLFL